MNPKWCNLAMQENDRFEFSKAMLTTENWNDKFQDYRFLPTTVKEAVNVEAPSLATYRKYQSEKDLIVLISQMLVWLLGMVNIKRSLNDGQILLISTMIAKEYFFLKVSEMKYCFWRGLMGDYGELYGKFDAMDVMKWLKTYTDIRANVMETESINSHSRQAKQETGYFDEKVFEKIKSLVKLDAETLRERELQTALNKVNFQLNRNELLVRKCSDILENEALKGFKDLETDSDEIKAERREFYEAEQLRVERTKTKAMKEILKLEELKEQLEKELAE